nr:MAG TPA: hypothetical protein [Caudoviricetes sp.]
MRCKFWFHYISYISLYRLDYIFIPFSWEPPVSDCFILHFVLLLDLLGSSNYLLAFP